MQKRVRIFAGPNGSGKSTIKSIVEEKVHLGTYINADEIKVQLTKHHILDFSLYNLTLRKNHFINTLRNSSPLIFMIFKNSFNLNTNDNVNFFLLQQERIILLMCNDFLGSKNRCFFFSRV